MGRMRRAHALLPSFVQCVSPSPSVVIALTRITVFMDRYETWKPVRIDSLKSFWEPII
jgi:hypothetical protein